MRSITISTLGGLALVMLSIGVGPATAAFPGANGKIALSRDKEIHTVDPDGRNLNRVTSLPDPSCKVNSTAPAWSPDGTKLAFTDACPGRIYTIDPDGRNLSLVVEWRAPGGAANPAWSPDGASIAFNTWTGNHCGEIHTTGLNGHGLTRLGKGTEPAWSPDGRKIVFTNNGRLYMMKPDGSSLLMMTSPPAWTAPSPHGECFSRGDYRPDWSPDSRSIVFERTHPDGNKDIYSMAVSTAGWGSYHTPVRLTYSNEREYAPAWSPDGRRIVFHQDGTPSLSVPTADKTFTMDATGAGWAELAWSGATPDWQALPAPTANPPGEPLFTPPKP